MSEETYNDEEILDDQEACEGEYGEESGEEDNVSPMPAWIISLAAHGLLALIMMGIYFGALIEDEEPPIRLSQMEVPPDDIEEEKEIRTIDDVKMDIVSDIIIEDPVVTDLDIPVEELETEDPVEEESNVPKGREEAVSSVEAGGAMAFMAIGAGSHASGVYGNRTGGGKKRAIGQNGGGVKSEAAVGGALRWFKKHQTVDGADKGMWDVDGYMDNCQEGIKCEPGTAHTVAGGDGDTACTAYAILCFLGAGHDHKTKGKFKDTVAMGIEWLKENQNEDGSFGGKKRNYENGVATMAICEAYAMTMDPTLKETAQKAVDNLLNRQSKTEQYPYGLGWDYTAAKATRNDSSVTGWCVMALKAAKSAGLDVGNGWAGAKTWLEVSWKASNPGVDQDALGSDSQSTFCYTYDAVADVAKGNKLESVGALCAIFLGKRPGDGMLDSLINKIAATQLPEAYPTNTYDMYYNTLNIFQYGGDVWKEWNGQVRDMLIDAQHGKDTGCFNGSWDFEGTKFHGHEVGRLLSTAYCTLSLEVYYRYQRIAGKNK